MHCIDRLIFIPEIFVDKLADDFKGSMGIDLPLFKRDAYSPSPVFSGTRIYLIDCRRCLPGS
jgi:hypothetical protein